MMVSWREHLRNSSALVQRTSTSTSKVKKYSTSHQHSEGTSLMSIDKQASVSILQM